jgi:hypothetical protein
LNLDAEVELSRPRNYATRKSLQASMQPHFERAARLLPASAIVLGWDRALGVQRSMPLPSDYRGVKGLCWCPTPTALEALKDAGAEPVPAPSVDVLARVNQRSFCAELGQTLPGACFVRDRNQLEETLREPPVTGRWLCKRAFGFAGRGQRRLSDLSRADDQRWLADCLEPGGLQIEPSVEIEAEFSIHGVLARSGALHVGSVCQQFLDADRFWLSAERLAPGKLSSEQLTALTAEAERVGSALHRAGYFGPFGIDAFLWKSNEGRLLFNSRSEINARLTMALPCGMGPDWLDLLLLASER